MSIDIFKVEHICIDITLYTHNIIYTLHYVCTHNINVLDTRNIVNNVADNYFK